MDFPAERLEYTLLNPSERAAAGDVSGQGMVSAQLSGSLGRRPISSEFALTVREPSGRVIGGTSFKTWAQQIVETSQLQLALALRLASAATCACEPHFLDLNLDDSASYDPSSSGSAEAVSHRYWVNGCLSYFDKIPRGFYSIYGMDPYFWAVCSNLQDSGKIPSLESLKTVDPVAVSSIEVISVDQRGDFNLKELLNRVLALSFSCRTRREVVDHLAKLVCDHMGGMASNGEVELSTIWEQCSNEIKACLGSIVLPIGHLPLGLCRHRSLLFKVLADSIGLPCRIAKGCNYCTKADSSSCLVQFGVNREYLVDLIGKPGRLYKPDSTVNGLSTILVASPIHFPQFKLVKPTIDHRSLARQFFLDFESLDIAFNNSSAAAVDGYTRNAMYPEPLERTHVDRTSCIPESSNLEDIYQLPAFAKVHNNEPFLLKPSHGQNVLYSSDMGKGALPLKFIPSIAHRDVQPFIDLVGPTEIVYKDTRYGAGDFLLVSRPSTQLAIDVEVLKIPWHDLVPRERIGAGSFGTVHRAQWNGFDVAVKILMEQNFQAEWMKEFLQEVAIMKRLHHPNIVLLIGAVTEPPNLSIVTEYMSRGSLHRLLHEPRTREILNERCRLSMAYNVASGMNYLHTRNPPIVHRDLKSPNLLVDSEYTVKVGDFGLSRSKANTFLSSKSAAGTPEWMAPEVLRNEQSDEKSDVYSFGVVLWELSTLQQPWADLKAPQVVAAVGFQGKRLKIPQDMNRQLAALIESCWANEPWRRPSFHSIMKSLKRLIELVPSISSY